MSGQIAVMPGIWRSVLALLLASVVVMGSPGPSTISATAMGAAFGLRRSLRYVCGLVVGTTAVLLAVAVGVVAVMLSIPYGARVLSLIASVYIVYLAWKIATAPPLDRASRPTVAPAFGGGFVLAIANPKAYLAIAAVFAGSTIVAADHTLDAVVKSALLAGMIVIIHLSWLLAGASLSRVLHDPVMSRVVNVSLAVALVAMTLAALVG
jgi:threonine/homoserine/homoserine lactone efflux protein